MQDFRNKTFEEYLRVIRKDGSVDYVTVNVMTTNNSVVVTKGENVIGIARCQRASDFDYKGLLFMATQKSKILERL